MAQKLHFRRKWLLHESAKGGGDEAWGGEAKEGEEELEPFDAILLCRLCFN